MRKAAGFMVIMVLILGIAGCSGASKAPAGSAGGGAPAASSESGKNPLAELAAKATGVDGMAFDLVMTSQSIGTKTMKGYVSGKATRMEMETAGQKVIMIRQANGDFYSYMPSVNMAIKMKPTGSAETPADWAEKYNEPKYTVKETGSETIDGISCEGYQILTGGQEESKMWVREDNGIPMKVEVAQAGDKIVVMYKNMRFGAQPVSLFELPAGVKITEQ
ncbi:MAG: DUF4412 domain-containing protein [Solirubrobacterales bacterium]